MAVEGHEQYCKITSQVVMVTEENIEYIRSVNLVFMALPSGASRMQFRTEYGQVPTPWNN